MLYDGNGKPTFASLLPISGAFRDLVSRFVQDESIDVLKRRQSFVPPLYGADGRMLPSRPGAVGSTVRVKLPERYQKDDAM